MGKMADSGDVSECFSMSFWHVLTDLGLDRWSLQDGRIPEGAGHSGSSVEVILRYSDAVGLGWDPGICILNQHPPPLLDSGVAGPWTTTLKNSAPGISGSL